jgi:hypothetical protein
MEQVELDMPEVETEIVTGLPAVIGHFDDARPSLARSAPTAAFISQLIAARDHMPIQRERRTVPVANALGAYASGASMTQRRMPQGFRKTVVA